MRTGSASAVLWPFFDLFLRLWLAQLFWLSGVQKITNWGSALYLATYEYPVSWLNPIASAYVGVTIEFLCPIFLALGLATRAAALPMLILSLVIHFEYQQFNSQVYWAVLLGWYVIMGAGPLSLDRQIGRGLVDSALPFTGRAQQVLRPPEQPARSALPAVSALLAGADLARKRHGVS